MVTFSTELKMAAPRKRGVGGDHNSIHINKHRMKEQHSSSMYVGRLFSTSSLSPLSFLVLQFREAVPLCESKFFNLILVVGSCHPRRYNCNSLTANSMDPSCWIPLASSRLFAFVALTNLSSERMIGNPQHLL